VRLCRACRPASSSRGSSTACRGLRRASASARGSWVRRLKNSVRSMQSNRFVRGRLDRDDGDDDCRRAAPSASGRTASGRPPSAGSAAARRRRDDHRWRRGLGDDHRRLSDNHRRLGDDDRRRAWCGSHHDGRRRRNHDRWCRRSRGRAERGAKARPRHRIGWVRRIGWHWGKRRIGRICWSARHTICLPWLSSRSMTFRLASSQFLNPSSERHSPCLWGRRRLSCGRTRAERSGLSIRPSASPFARSDR
jgi:hypothetical protein